MSALSTAAAPQPQSIARRAFTATLYVYLGKFGNSVLTLPITLLLVKGLSVQDYGAYGLFGSILFFSSVFTNLGTLGVLQRYIPEFIQKNEPENVRQTVKWTSAIRLSGGLICTGVFLIFADPIFSLLNLPESYKAYTFLLSLLILISIEVQLLGDGVLGSLLDQKALTLGRFFSNLLKLGAIFLAFSLGYGLKGAVAGWLISLVALLIFYGTKVYLEVFKGRIDVKHHLPNQRMVRYGKFYLAGVFGTFLYDIAIDNFVISHYLGTSEVGRYTFAVFIASLAGYLFPIRLVTPIVVNVAIRRYAETGATEVLSKMFTFFNKLIFFGIMPAAVGIFVLSDEIIVHIFDQKYAATSSVAIVILLFSLFRYLNYALQILIKPLEILHLSLLRYGCSFINLILDLWLVPKMGIMGAALATGGTIALNYAIVYLLVRRYVTLQQDWKGIFRVALNLLIMGSVILLLKGWITGPFGLVVVIATGASVYFAASFVNRVFTNSERDLINSAVGKQICIF